MSVTGRIHSEESFSTLDGPGVRYVVFLQGCPLRCKYCHNVDSWDFKSGSLSTAAETAERIIKCRSFIGGVTLSGGEPLMQVDFCKELLKLCKNKDLHTAIDTSGIIPISSCEKALNEADMLLLDIKSADPEMCKKLTGRDNKNSIELLNWCERHSKKVWVRHVILKDYTLEENQLRKLGKMLSEYSCIEQVTLLPFHKMGEYKWQNSGRQYELYNTPPPTEQEMQWAKEIVKQYEKRVQ